MFKFKKGQAAMEFLMTYGWAILVVLAAIAALAYFGVLSPDRFMPEKCTLPSGTACLDFTGSTSSVVLVVQNAAGFDMDSVAVDVTPDGGAAVACVDAGADAILANGEKDTFTCTGVFAEGKLKAAIGVDYTNRQTSLNHTKAGELILKIE